MVDREHLEELADEIVAGMPDFLLLTTEEWNSVREWLEEWLRELIENG